MKFKKILVWSAIHMGAPHPLLTKEEKQIRSFIPLVDALFPGINYYSISGFYHVLDSYVIPALKKLFPTLQWVTEGNLGDNEIMEIEKFLPTKGYEWQDSKR